MSNEKTGLIKVECFEVEIKMVETATPPEKLTENDEGVIEYAEPVVDEIVEKLEGIENVEKVRRVDKK